MGDRRISQAIFGVAVTMISRARKGFADVRLSRGAANSLVLGIAMLVCVACGSGRLSDAEATRGFDDIHERLSDVIARDGFSHRIISERDDSVHLDSIHLRFPLDGIKRRHEGVERVLVSIARVCSLPEFALLPIRIVVATADEDDGKYLRAVLDRETGAGANVSVQVVVGSGDSIVIAVRHPPRFPRQK